MTAVSVLCFGASDCVLWRLQDASGSESVDIDTSFADSGWVVTVQIVWRKSRVAQDRSKSGQDR